MTFSYWHQRHFSLLLLIYFPSNWFNLFQQKCFPFCYLLERIRISNFTLNIPVVCVCTRMHIYVGKFVSHWWFLPDLNIGMDLRYNDCIVAYHTRLYETKSNQFFFCEELFNIRKSLVFTLPHSHLHTYIYGRCKTMIRTHTRITHLRRLWPMWIFNSLGELHITPHLRHLVSSCQDLFISVMWCNIMCQSFCQSL